MKLRCHCSFLSGKPSQSTLILHRNQTTQTSSSSQPNELSITNVTNRAPRGYWSNISNQRKFFDDLGKELGITNLDDWYSVLNRRIIIDKGVSFLDRYYQNSPMKAITAVYSEHNWLPWKFEKAPNSIWDSIHTRRKFFDWLGKELGIKQLDDWYNILDTQIVVDNGGSFAYKKSPIEDLIACYPEHNWIPWNFRRAGPWKWQQSPQSFFDWLGKQIGVKQLDDWYSLLSRKLVCDYNGRYILDRSPKESPVEALKLAYPEHNWLPWKFSKVGRGFWMTKENQRMYFDWLGQQLGVKQLEDWYQVLSLEALKGNHGRGLLKWYNESAVSALMAIYPEHHWQPWKFEKCSLTQKHYETQQQMSEYLSDLADKLAIRTLDDWYRVDMIQIHKLGSLNLIRKRGGLIRILREQYPDHPWDYRKFHTKKKAQRWLVISLKKMFPDEEVIEDYSHPKAVFHDTKRAVQLDAYIPAQSLAFEYQGEHHFQNIHLYGESERYQRRDEEKRNVCAANNIKLIEVPYWWDRTQEGLQQIIRKAKTPSFTSSAE